MTNSASIYYGLHFYPGVAEYQEPDKAPYRVFLNEENIRKMGPSFVGKPVFVFHVGEIEKDLNKLRGEADGWVVESFYNPADGKHWVKFVVCSDKGEQAIKRGMKLSNCYIPKSFGPGGTWNGVTYEREITDGEYEHLAIVPNPRYEESVIMTPEQFKKYNDDKLLEIKRLSNNKKGDEKMKFNFFKKSKVENSVDWESMSVVLPKSGKEIEIVKLINEADDKELKKNEPQMAHPDHMVEVKGEKMTVNQLMKKYDDLCAKNEEDDEDSSEDPSSMNDDEQDLKYSETEVPKSEDDKESEKKTLILEEEEEKEVKDSKEESKDDREEEKEKKKNAKEKAERLRNAHNQSYIPTATVVLSMDQVARGKQLYGSN